MKTETGLQIGLLALGAVVIFASSNTAREVVGLPPLTTTEIKPQVNSPVIRPEIVVRQYQLTNTTCGCQGDVEVELDHLATEFINASEEVQRDYIARIRAGLPAYVNQFVNNANTVYAAQSAAAFSAIVNVSDREIYVPKPEPRSLPFQARVVPRSRFGDATYASRGLLMRV